MMSEFMFGENEEKVGAQTKFHRQGRNPNTVWYGVGTLTDVQGNINSEKYQDILENNLWPVLARHFPTGSYLFQGPSLKIDHGLRVSK